MKYSLSHVFQMLNDFNPDRMADGHKFSINNVSQSLICICLFYLFGLSSENTQKPNSN